MLSIKEKQRKEIYKEKKGKEIMKNCYIAKCIKALETTLRISAILASICLLMLVWTYSIAFLYAAFVLSVIILISLIALNYIPTSSES